jgi:sialate O-acetylesterase
VRFPAFSSSNDPIEMTVSSGGEVLRFSDVLIGDVWLCSGQSNMAMGVGAQKRAKEIIAGASNPKLRLFLVQRQVAFEPANTVEGEWVVCSPESILMDGGWKGFSAVGYFFGQAVQQSQGLPVGLIGSYVGGTNIMSWMSKETLSASPPGTAARKRLADFFKAKEELPEATRIYQEKLKPEWDKVVAEHKAEHQRKLKVWNEARAAAQSSGQPIPPRPTSKLTALHPRNPETDYSLATTLFNGMIEPLAPFALRGVIWYQGEANAYPGMDTEYRSNLKDLVADWRRLWNQGDFPFLYVQLPNLESAKDNWPVLPSASVLLFWLVLLFMGRRLLAPGR